MLALFQRNYSPTSFMRIYTLRQLPFLLLAVSLFVTRSFAQTPPFSLTSDPHDTLGRQLESEQYRMIDPALGLVPHERLAEERKQMMKQENTGGFIAQSPVPGMTWQERGPSNAGGRTRAVLFDPNDATHKKVWAGSPAGGLWYTNDITDANATWMVVSDNWENIVVTCLANDPSNTQVMYAGTGDGFRGVNGGGIWKTTDGGNNWTRLSSTIPGTSYGTLAASFGYTQRLVVNTNGHVFAATRYGVVRSIDGGANWQFVLAPSQGIGGVGPVTNNYSQDFVSDLEIGTDNILYAAFSPSRVFRANNFTGLTWMEVTPTGVPAGSERTELALAQSTSGASQIIYAVARGYNNVTYNQDVRWFRRSADGGVSWSAVMIPTYSSGEHFTNGNGYYAISLTVDPTNAAVVYAGGYGYAWFRSTTSGSSWSGALSTNYNYTYQHGLLLHPDNAANAVLISDQGVTWTTGWGNATNSTAPVVQSRNTGYRVSEVSSAAMKSAPGGSYLLAAVGSLGVLTLPTPGLSAATSPIYSSVDGSAQTFIDSDDPSVQIFNAYSSWYLYRNNTYSNLFGLSNWASTNPAAYDSPNNNLYVTEYANGIWSVRRTTNVGGTIAYTNFAIADYPYYMTLGTNQQSLFVACSSGLITRYTNLSQTTPTATVVATGTAFPQYGSVSCIDVGASENELLVTFSNYGVSSVWYTSNGGATWVNKDATGSGLPDVPVRSALFNPQNRLQVFLGTDLGVWSTTDISADNPGWTLSSTGMGLTRVNQLRYRPSDGRLTAATAGRGIFESNTLAIPYTPSSISITGISNTTLCAGSTVAVSFTASGPISSTTANYEVWISDATGNLPNQQRLGMGNGSPISVTLPTGYNALAYGTGYRLKVVAPDGDVQSLNSVSLAIGNLSKVEIVDKTTAPNSSYSGTAMCLGDQVRLLTRVEGSAYQVYINPETYTWLLNGTSVTSSTSGTLLAQTSGNYQVIAKQAGCTIQSSTYSVQVVNSGGITSIISPIGGFVPRCADSPVKLTMYYAGETASLQWSRDGIAISGATSYTHAATISGSYSISVSNGQACNLVSYPERLQFGTSLYANILLSPATDSVLCAGASKGYTVMRAASISDQDVTAGVYSLKWYKNNALYTTATNYISTSEPGAYTMELSQGSCKARSNALVISEGTIIPPSIANRSGSNVICPGRSAWLQLMRNHYATYNTVQWQRNGIDIPGATSDTYYPSVIGSYTVRVTKGTCSVISAPVSISVSEVITPGFVDRINNLTKLDGMGCTEYRMSCNLYIDNGTYQWFRNGQLITGATGSGYTATQSGLYSFSVSGTSSNSVCGGKSRDLYVQIGRVSKPVLSLNQLSSGVCQNNMYSLTTEYDQGTLQWKRNGVPIPIGTPNPYAANLYYAGLAGIYSVVLQDGSCSAESDPVEIKIGEPTAATITGAALVGSGQVAMLPVALSGPAPWSFTLSNGQSVQNTYLNPYPLTVTPSATTVYSIAAVQNACGTGTVSGQSTVTVGLGSADLTLSALVSSRTPKVNDLVSYSLIITNESQQESSGVQVTSRLPAGVEFVDAQTGDVSFVNGVVSANVGTVLASSNTTVSYRVRITQPGTFFTAAQVAATNTPDPDSQPNSGTGDGQDDAALVDLRTLDAGGTLVASANPNQAVLPRTQSSQPPVAPNTVELALSLGSGSITPKLYDVVSLSLTVSNRGGATATNVIVQTVLPAGWQLTSIAGLVVTGQTVNAYVPQLVAGGKAVVVLPVQVGALGNSQIQAQILDVNESVSNARPGNGFQNGERDEANLQMRVR